MLQHHSRVMYAFPSEDSRTVSSLPVVMTTRIPAYCELVCASASDPGIFLLNFTFGLLLLLLSHKVRGNLRSFMFYTFIQYDNLCV